MIAFEPGKRGIEVFDDALVLGGDMTAPIIQALLASLDAGQPRLVISGNG
jgi:hypothetical protein